MAYKRYVLKASPIDHYMDVCDVCAGGTRVAQLFHADAQAPTQEEILLFRKLVDKMNQPLVDWTELAERLLLEDGDRIQLNVLVDRETRHTFEFTVMGSFD